MRLHIHKYCWRSKGLLRRCEDWRNWNTDTNMTELHFLRHRFGAKTYMSFQVKLLWMTGTWIMNTYSGPRQQVRCCRGTDTFLIATPVVWPSLCRFCYSSVLVSSSSGSSSAPTVLNTEVSIFLHAVLNFNKNNSLYSASTSPIVWAACSGNNRL